MFVFLRIGIGLVFLVSGLEKTLSPYQNFLYAIQAYALLPGWAEEWTAKVFPWMELFAGLFLVLGLWTRHMLSAVMVFFAVFISVVGQALLRGIDIEHCGCFGQLIHVSARIVIVADSLMLLLTIILFRHLPKTDQFSLDRFLRTK